MRVGCRRRKILYLLLDSYWRRVHVLLDHSIAVTPFQNKLYSHNSISHYLFRNVHSKTKAEVEFHYPFWLPNWKAELEFHYSIWNINQSGNQLLTTCFGTITPNGKLKFKIPLIHYPSRSKCGSARKLMQALSPQTVGSMLHLTTDVVDHAEKPHGKL